MNKYINFYKTIHKHRKLVRQLCFKCGFYKRGLLHDLSKFSKTEFWSSARYFNGSQSPINIEKREKGYSLAWQHHKGHNPHHWEYWIDNVGTRTNTPIEIPYEYVVEMICDWVSAGIVYSGRRCDYNKPYSDPKKYHEAHKSERIIHPKTSELIDTFLNTIEKEGVNAFCRQAKKLKIERRKQKWN